MGQAISSVFNRRWCLLPLVILIAACGNSPPSANVDGSDTDTDVPVIVSTSDDEPEPDDGDPTGLDNGDPTGPDNGDPTGADNGDPTDGDPTEPDNGDPDDPVPAAPEDRASASRFLAQTTFGPTTASIDALLQSSYADWLEQQFTLPVTSMRDAFDAEQAFNPAAPPSRDWVHEIFWRQSVNAEDQLRQRLAFALSQIFVISFREAAVAAHPRGVADFYTMLSRNAFGNFRTLLEDVSLHPMMGSYLSHLGNEKGDELSGRVPDENFAREIMQLFTIGLHQLKIDGSPELSATSTPVESYTTADVEGLARVFTGFSWNGPDTATGRFQGWIASADRDVLPMQAYPQFHSSREKRFLGAVIDAQSNADPVTDLTIALDTLFTHPNVGPFIGRQLIQRLVTSNPSNAYVARVAQSFNNNGAGIRGDLQAVLRSIFLDPEARNAAVATQPGYGRIREPILRLTHWMRSFNAISSSGRYQIFNTDDAATSLGMTALGAPSVFNFYRPGYVPPQTPIATAGLVSPEMQLIHETSVAGYLNSMLNSVVLGTGFANDIKSSYPHTVPLASDPEALIEHLNTLLLHGSMSLTLRNLLHQAIAAVDLPVTPDETQEQALRERTQIAVFLALASPEYIVLK